MSSNLPPGVSVNMIPGNRPEDIAEEAYWDHLIEWTEKQKLNLPPDWYGDPGNPIVLLVEHVREEALQQGFEEGRAEEQMARAAEESEPADEESSS